MTKAILNKIRVISIIFGFFYIAGFIWFSDIYLIKPVYAVFFDVSVGVALFVIPIIPDRLRKYMFVQLMSFLLGITGIISNISVMVDELKYEHLVDKISSLIINLITLTILILLIFDLSRKNKKKDGD